MPGYAFNSRGIKLSAAISTLVVSIFYLIPQMVGAGALVEPLLGISYLWGVLIVGVVVILIVVTAGMVSTTWVQFIKGSLLVIFCAGLTVMILHRGLTADPNIGRPQTITKIDGKTYVNGTPQGHGPGEADLRPVGRLSKLPGGVTLTGPSVPLNTSRRFRKAKSCSGPPRNPPCRAAVKKPSTRPLRLPEPKSSCPACISRASAAKPLKTSATLSL